MHVVVRDEVEGDVDTSGARGHGIGVLIYGPPIESIYLRRLGYPSGGADLLSHVVELRQGTPGEEDACPSRANARATAPPMAPPPP